ncbi:MAG: TetR/AcrR family transcriptional regulator [Pseudomonadales bacterium]
MEEILVSACEVLVRDGYAGFNLRKVAAEVGVQLRTVQYHFKNREALLGAAVERALIEWGRAYFDIVKTPESAEQKLRDVLRLNLDLTERPSTSQLLLECFALAQHDALIREIVQSQYYEYRRLIAKLLHEIRPDLSDEGTMGFATVFAAQMEGLTVVLHSDDPNRPNEAALRLALDVQCDAFISALREHREPGARVGRGATERR